jgi:hypothetical protein
MHRGQGPLDECEWKRGGDPTNLEKDLDANRPSHGSVSEPGVEAPRGSAPAPPRAREPQASAERSEPGEEAPRGFAAWRRGTESPFLTSER